VSIISKTIPGNFRKLCT